MKKEDMVVGRGYLHSQAPSEVYVYEGSGEGSRGRFVDKDGDSYAMPYSYMTEATEAKPEFAIDDEIEVSEDANFTHGIIKGRFKYLDPEGDYWIAKNSDGAMWCAGDFARKVKVDPMVPVTMDNVYPNTGVTTYLIPKSLADQIKAGEFS
jgi:hypothetical protein